MNDLTDAQWQQKEMDEFQQILNEDHEWEEWLIKLDKETRREQTSQKAMDRSAKKR